MTHFFKGTREPVIGHMPSFVKQPGRAVEKTDGRMTDGEGELNAGSKKELAEKVNALLTMATNGSISAGAEFSDQAGQERKLQAQAEKHNAFVSAWHSQDDQMKVMAEVVGNDLYEALNRQGFANSLLMYMDVADKTDTRIPLHRKDVAAFQVINDGEGIAQHVEQSFIYPEDYKLQCQILVDEGELAVAGPDFLDRKVADALESIMVKQDNILRNLMLRSAGVFNAPFVFSSFGPNTVSGMRTQILANQGAPHAMVFAVDLWDDLIAGSQFNAWWEPVHKYQLIMEGRIGRLLGMQLITDGSRVDRLRVLDPGEAFVTSTPVNFGVRGVRRKVQGTEINLYPLGTAKRGMFFVGIECMHILDRGSVYARRA